MHADAGLTPEFLKVQLKSMAEMKASEATLDNFGLFAGIVATMNMLEPEGYPQVQPSFTFQPISEET